MRRVQWWAQVNWKAAIKTLPPGLTPREAASRLGLPYHSVRAALRLNGYRAADARTLVQNSRRKLIPDRIKWTMSNADIARRFGVSREAVRQLRNELGKPFVESRGYRPANKRKLLQSSRTRA